MEHWERKTYASIRAKCKNSSYVVVLFFFFPKQDIPNPFRHGVVSSTGSSPTSCPALSQYVIRLSLNLSEEGGHWHKCPFRRVLLGLYPFDSLCIWLFEIGGPTTPLLWGCICIYGRSDHWAQDICCRETCIHAVLVLRVSFRLVVVWSQHRMPLSSWRTSPSFM